MASTIKDIRNETGLALSTISKYLNGGNVREENAVKIEEAVKKLDYHPNELARALITKQTRTVSFVVNDITSQFCGTMLRHAVELLRQKGYSAIFCDSAQDPALEAENIRFCMEKNVDGILLIPCGASRDTMQPALDAGIPVVLIDREIKGSDCDCVILDNREAAYREVSYLIGRGHKKIGAIYSMEYTGYQRYLGYCDAMKEANLTVPETYLFPGPRHSAELGYEGIKSFMKLETPPTAVFLSNYEVNLGAVMALNEKGVNCPEQVSLAGFDELVLSLVMKPKMTVMAQPMEAMCDEAVCLLLERITSDEDIPPRRICMPAVLKERESVRSIDGDA